MTRTLTLLGSTGSIGKQSLQVCKKLNIKVNALAARSNVDLLTTQAREFNPRLVVIEDKEKYSILKDNLKDTNIKVLCGYDEIENVASSNLSDTVLNSIVGIAGLKATIAAVKSGVTLALANKESLVTAGALVNKLAKENNSKILPVDSEHSAIFQCLEENNKIKKILLTASGGPFYGMTQEQLKNIKPKDALKNPNWSMGNKITIDSSTLMNKGLEVIEAIHLFNVTVDQIEILVHRQSIVHSAVEFFDNAIKAQLGVPNMAIPIQYSLTYPDRYESLATELDLFKAQNLTFSKPDMETFTCLKAALKAAKIGGLATCIVNGANEEAVMAFLNNKIGFLDIGTLVNESLNNFKNIKDYNLNDVIDADKSAREFVRKTIS